MALTVTEFINEALNIVEYNFKIKFDFFGKFYIFIKIYTKTLLYNNCSIS